MRRLVLPLAPLAVLVAAAVPATAGAAQVTHFSVKREMASAVFRVSSGFVGEVAA